MFLVGVAIIGGYFSVPVNKFTAGITLMVLGIGAVFGKDTFRKILEQYFGTDEESKNK